MLATVKFEGHIAGTRIFCVVVSKFSYWKEPSLIILLVVDKSPEISLYCTVLPLGLAISLRLEDSSKLLFDLQEVV